MLAEECNVACTMDYSPVCGKSGETTKTFPNACALDVHNCQHNTGDNYDIFNKILLSNIYH